MHVALVVTSRDVLLRRSTYLGIAGCLVCSFFYLIRSSGALGIAMGGVIRYWANKDRLVS